MTTLDPRAIDALKNNQRQLDMDGCEVGVSRQALDELLSAYAALSQPQAGEPFGWARKHVKNCNPAYHFTRDKKTATKWKHNGETPVPLYASPPPSGKVEALRKIEYALTKASLCDAEKISDALSLVRRALSVAPATADGWREITEDNQPPLDTDVIMGCWETLPKPHWTTEIGHYGSKRGGWIHGRMTHWLPLDRLPAAPTATGGR